MKTLLLFAMISGVDFRQDVKHSEVEMFQLDTFIVVQSFYEVRSVRFNYFTTDGIMSRSQGYQQGRNGLHFIPLVPYMIQPCSMTVEYGPRGIYLNRRKSLILEW